MINDYLCFGVSYEPMILGSIFIRLTNAIHLSGLNERDIWSVAKEIKLKISLDKKCGEDGLYNYNYAFDYDIENPDPVTILEQRLKTKRSEQRFDNITRIQFETAGKIIIYLHTCPGKIKLGIDSNNGVEQWFKTWYLFYQDLFQTKSPNLIILTLNRMAQNYESFKIDQKLLERAATLLKLRYKEIQRLLSGTETNNFTGGQNIKNINMFKIEGKT